jgi:hypothetical protein
MNDPFVASRAITGSQSIRMSRSGFKTPSKAQWLRCKPLQNVLLIRQSALADCAFSYVAHDASGVPRLAFEPNLRF